MVIPKKAKMINSKYRPLVKLASTSKRKHIAFAVLHHIFFRRKTQFSLVAYIVACIPCIYDLHVSSSNTIWFIRHYYRNSHERQLLTTTLS